KDGPPPPQGGDGSGMVDFRGEKRSNATHESSTDAQAKLMRKGNGQPAKLSYGGHALLETRHGLCLDIKMRCAPSPETAAAKEMLARQGNKRIRPQSLGADKRYHTKDFVKHL